MFEASLDGQTITLTQYTNCLTTGDAGSTTCLPPASGSTDNGWPGNPAQVTQFGPSAFFIHNKTLTIDATANGMTQGIVIARDTTKNNFRLFDVTPPARSPCAG